MTKTKYNNVGLKPQVDRKLKQVCKYRGWTKTVAVERMTDRELADIEREQAAHTAQSSTG
jgi:hypothetical protein